MARKVRLHSESAFRAIISYLAFSLALEKGDPMSEIVKRAQQLVEYKVIRRVRTPAGVRRYKQPIGSIIVRDGVLRNLDLLTPEWDGWERVRDRNTGRKFDIGRDEEDGKWYVYGEGGWDDLVVGPVDTEEEAYLILDDMLTPERDRIKVQADKYRSKRPGSFAREALGDSLNELANEISDNSDKKNRHVYDDILGIIDQYDGAGAGGTADEFEVRALLRDYYERNRGVMNDTQRSAVESMINELTRVGKLPPLSASSVETDLTFVALRRQQYEAEGNQIRPVKYRELTSGMWVSINDSDWVQVIDTIPQSARAVIVRGRDRQGNYQHFYRVGPRTKIETVNDPDRIGQPIAAEIPLDQPQQKQPPKNALKKIRSEWEDWERFKGADGKVYDLGEEDGRWYATGPGGWDEIVAEGNTRDEVYNALLSHVTGAPASQADQRQASDVLKPVKGEWEGWDRFRGADGNLYDVGEEDGTWYATGPGGWDEIIAEGNSRDEVMEKLTAHLSAGVSFAPQKTEVSAPEPEPKPKAKGKTKSKDGLWENVDPGQVYLNLSSTAVELTDNPDTQRAGMFVTVIARDFGEGVIDIPGAVEELRKLAKDKNYGKARARILRAIEEIEALRNPRTQEEARAAAEKRRASAAAESQAKRRVAELQQEAIRRLGRSGGRQLQATTSTISGDGDAAAGLRATLRQLQKDDADFETIESVEQVMHELQDGLIMPRQAASRLEELAELHSDPNVATTLTTAARRLRGEQVEEPEAPEAPTRAESLATDKEISLMKRGTSRMPDYARQEWERFVGAVESGDRDTADRSYERLIRLFDENGVPDYKGPRAFLETAYAIVKRGKPREAPETSAQTSAPKKATSSGKKVDDPALINTLTTELGMLRNRVSYLNSFEVHKTIDDLTRKARNGEVDARDVTTALLNLADEIDQRERFADKARVEDIRKELRRGVSVIEAIPRRYQHMRQRILQLQKYTEPGEDYNRGVTEHLLSAQRLLSNGDLDGANHFLQSAERAADTHEAAKKVRAEMSDADPTNSKRAARIKRQEAIDRVRPAVDLIGEAAETVMSGNNLATIRTRLDSMYKRNKTSTDDFITLNEIVNSLNRRSLHTDSGRRDVLGDLRRIARKRNLSLISAPNEEVRYDPAKHEAVGPINPGNRAIVIRPGFEFEYEGERIVLNKPVVVDNEPVAIRPTTQKPAENLPQKRSRGRSASRGSTASPYSLPMPSEERIRRLAEQSAIVRSMLPKNWGKSLEAQLEWKADKPKYTGAIVAFIPRHEDAGRLAVEDGESPDELHVTAYYLGDDADEFNDDARQAIITTVRNVVRERPKVHGEVFSVNFFNPGSKEREPCVVYGVGGRELAKTRYLIAKAIDRLKAGMKLPLAEQHAPWVPHITAAYTEDESLFEAMKGNMGPVVFDRVRVAFAGEHVDIPFDSSPAESLFGKCMDILGMKRELRTK